MPWVIYRENVTFELCIIHLLIVKTTLGSKRSTLSLSPRFEAYKVSRQYLEHTVNYCLDFMAIYQYEGNQRPATSQSTSLGHTTLFTSQKTSTLCHEISKITYFLTSHIPHPTLWSKISQILALPEATLTFKPQRIFAQSHCNFYEEIHMIY